jgi:hypothetical protein
MAPSLRHGPLLILARITIGAEELWPEDKDPASRDRKPSGQSSCGTARSRTARPIRTRSANNLGSSWMIDFSWWTSVQPEMRRAASSIIGRHCGQARQRTPALLAKASLRYGRSDELGKSLIIVKEIQISVLRNPTPVLKSDPELSSNFIGSSLSATFQP